MTTTSFLIALAGLVIGVVIGYLLNKATHPNEKQRKQLELQLQQSRDELNQYRRQVTGHFLQTSKHFNDLTQQYKQLHEHLAEGAMTLASPEISRQMIEAGEGKMDEHHSPLIFSGEMPAPPKDYAPKVPGGVLSEHYGLQDEKSKNSDIPLTLAGQEAHNEEDDDPTLKVG